VHPFEALCARLGSEHRHVKVRHAWTNGKAERSVQTVKDLLEELLRRKLHRTIDELQAHLDEQIARYNSCGPHQDLHHHGRPPVQVIRGLLRAKEEITAA
jgi:transposase InsO family protein